MPQSRLERIHSDDTSSGLLELSLEATISVISYYRSRTGPCPALNESLSNIVSQCRLAKELLSGTFTQPPEPALAPSSQRLLDRTQRSVTNKEIHASNGESLAQAFPEILAQEKGVEQSFLSWDQYDPLSDLAIKVSVPCGEIQPLSSNQDMSRNDALLSWPVEWDVSWVGPREDQIASFRHPTPGIFNMNPNMTAESLGAEGHVSSQSFASDQKVKPSTTVNHGLLGTSVYAGKKPQDPPMEVETCHPNLSIPPDFRGV